MKKIYIICLITSFLLFLCACGNQTDSDLSTTEYTDAYSNSSSDDVELVELDTLGSKFQKVFESSTCTTAAEIVEEMISENLIYEDLESVPVEPGPLDGFCSEVTGFTSGVKFVPSVSSIPFVGYVFETDDPSALCMSLLDIADPNWTLEAEADEMLSIMNGDFVLFLMCPSE